nr:putative nucleotidyltransferase, ribonuclease H [Tanacetum cinerariifolium]
MIEGKFKPIYYASKTLNDAQAHYTTTEKELLAIVFSFDKFCPYFILSKTVVYTNHIALKYLLSKQDTKPRLIRWVLLLQGFNIEIEYKKGDKNLAALSRLENPNIGELAEEKITDKFPDEHLMILKTKPNDEKPWYADYVNYIVGKVVPPKWTPERKNGSSLKLTGGHHSASVTGRKVYKAGFYCPSIFIDAKDYVMKCDACHKLGNISSRNKMPQNNIQVCEVFDVWGLDFMGPFPDSRGNKYILVEVYPFYPLVYESVSSGIQSSGNLKMSGNEDHHRQGRRFAAGGNGHDGRDPRDVEIERLRQRVCKLEIQHKIRQIRKRIRELELQREMRKETESRYVVRDDVNEEEEYPSLDSYPRSFELIYPDIYSEDEPRFDEEEFVNTDYEEAPVFDDDPYEAKTKNIFSSIFTFDDIERNEGEKGLVKGDGPTMVTGGPVASMATLPFVPKVQVGLLVEARF